MTIKGITFKRKRLWIWFSGILLTLIVGISAVYLHAVSKDFYFNEINTLVKSTAGYTLEKSGPLEFSLLPRPTLTARQLKVLNASAPEAADIAQSRTLSLLLQWGPLLSGKLVVDGELLSTRISLTTDASGERNWMTEELSTITGGLPFELDRIDARLTEFLFTNHQKNEILGLDLHQLDLDLAGGSASADIETAGRFGDSRFFAIGNASYASEIGQGEISLDIGAGRSRSIRVGDIDAPSVSEWIRQNAASFPVQSTLTGTLSFQDGLLHGELEVMGELSRVHELDYLVEQLGYVRPDLGPLTATANLTVRNSDLDLRNLDLRLQQSGANLELSGNIDNLLSTPEISIDISGKVDHPGTIVDFGADLTGLGPTTIRSQITGQANAYKLRNTRVTLQDNNVVSTTDGYIEVNDGILQLDLDTSLKVRNTQNLEAYLPQLPEPLLENLETEASATIRGTPQDLAVADLNLKLFRDDRTLVATGGMSMSPSGVSTDIDFHYTTLQPIGLNKYFPKLQSLQIVGPLDLAGSVIVRDDFVHLSNLTLQTAQTDLQGDIRIDLHYDPPRVIAVFDSTQFNSTLVRADMEEEPDEQAAQKVVKQPDQMNEAQQEQLEKTFNEYLAGVKVETDWIRNLRVYFSFTAERAQVGDYQLDDQRVIVDIADGVFALAQYEITLNGKPFSLRGLIDTNTDPPSYFLSGELEGDTIEALLNVEENIFIGGELSGNFRLGSEGATLAKVIEHMNGQALITMGPLDIRSNALSIFSSDIVTSILGGVVSPKKDEPTSSYKCAVLGVDVKNGVVQIDKSFAMESRSYNLAGRGEVNLNTGYIDLSVNPRARRGLGLSVSTLVGGFRIKGHMATPNFSVGGGGLVTAMVTGYALSPSLAVAVSNPATATILATGFFAKGIFDRLTASNYSCQNTLKRIERNRKRLDNDRPPHSGKMSF